MSTQNQERHRKSASRQCSSTSVQLQHGVSKARALSSRRAFAGVSSDVFCSLVVSLLSPQLALGFGSSLDASFPALFRDFQMVSNKIHLGLRGFVNHSVPSNQAGLAWFLIRGPPGRQEADNCACAAVKGLLHSVLVSAPL